MLLRLSAPAKASHLIHLIIQHTLHSTMYSVKSKLYSVQCKYTDCKVHSLLYALFKKLHSTIYFTLFKKLHLTVYFTLFSTFQTVHLIHIPQQSMPGYCTLSTRYKKHCMLYSVQCTVYSVQCKVYSIHWTLPAPLSSHTVFKKAFRGQMIQKNGHLDTTRLPGSQDKANPCFKYWIPRIKSPTIF